MILTGENIDLNSIFSATLCVAYVLKTNSLVVY